MRMKHLTRALAVLLAASLTLGFSGCGETALLFSQLPSAEIQKWTTGDAITQTADMLGLGAMKQVASEGGLTLYLNEKTTEIAVKTADGTVWYSNPQNRLNMNSSMLGQYSSTMLVTTIDSAETSKQMNTFDDCVKYGQFTIKPITGGVRIDYNFGQVVKTPIYPQVLTADRFKELTAGLSKTEQSNMKRYYLEVNYDTVTDTQSLKNLETLYTKIKDIKHIYVLKQSPSALETNRITGYFNKLNYTLEMREQDQEAVGYTDADKAKGNFGIPVEYTLKNGRLNAHIPVSEIKTTSNMKLDNLILLPFMNTESGLTDSQAVVPDGSGAIMDLSTIRSGNTAEYEEGFYGQDYALYQANKTSRKKSLYLPVYGLTASDGAMLAVIGQSDATASVYAAARTSGQDMGYIGAEFKLMDYAKVLLTPTDTQTVNSYADKSIGDDIAVDFTFLSRTSNKWTDIAAAYRSRLKSEGALKSSDSRKVPVMADLVGAIDDTVPVMGIPHEVIYPLTTFAQAGKITDKLNRLFPDNPLDIRYTGWRKGGVKSSVLTGFDAESKLGGKKDLLAFSEKVSGYGMLFPDADFQYVYRNTLFDAFNSTRDVVRFITSEAAFKPVYNKANFLPDKDSLYGYVLKPDLMASHVESFLKFVNLSGLQGFCLPYMSSDLSGDFSKNDFVTRNAAKTYSVQVLQKMKAAGYQTMSEGANAYTLPYLNVAVELPTEANAHPMISRSVPFVQMVLSGSVQFGADELNKAADDRYYLLKCIETGSALYFTAIYAPNSAVKDTNYSDYYNVNYDVIAPRVKAVGSELLKALEPVYGSEMTGHTELSNGVVRVDYANGKGILINYNQTDVSTADGVVPAAGWLSVGGK